MSSILKILNLPEDENLEFKAARNQYDFDKLVRYSAALANEGGGYFVLGVSDKRPRTIVGTSTFRSLAKTRADLIKRLKIRIETEEELHAPVRHPAAGSRHGGPSPEMHDRWPLEWPTPLSGGCSPRRTSSICGKPPTNGDARLAVTCLQAPRRSRCSGESALDTTPS